MVHCVAFGCTNSSNKGHLLKRFPKDPERRAIWEQKVRRKNWKSTNSSRLCEEHFDEQQWEKIRSDGKRKLKWNAIPTVFCFTKQLNSKSLVKAVQHNKESSASELKLKPHDQECNEDRPSCVDPMTPCTRSSSTDVGTDVPLVSDFPSTVISEDQNEHSECISKLKSVSQNYEIHLLKKEKELYDAKRKIIRLKRSNARLRQAMHRARKIDNPTVEENLKKVFNPDQMQVLARSSKHCTKWSDETINTALALRFACGTSAYEAIRKRLPYPTLRTLQKKIEELKTESVILQELECVANSDEKESDIVLDEKVSNQTIDDGTTNNAFVDDA